MIALTVLGSGGAVPTPRRGPAAYWLELDGSTALVDPGPGALVRLMAHPRGPGDVDGIRAVVLTHLHLDHCADLAPLLFALHSCIPQAVWPLQLIGPPGLAGYLERLRDLYGDWLQPCRRPLEVIELRPGKAVAPAAGGAPAEQAAVWRRADEEELAGGGAAIIAHAANHSENRFSGANLCLRCRDAAGGVLCYSGDGEPGPGLLAAARGADLLVVECSTPDALATPGHMTPSAVADLCVSARPRRVVLTHLYPPAEALDLPALIGRRFDGPVHTAHDGLVLTVP